MRREPNAASAFAPRLGSAAARQRQQPLGFAQVGENSTQRRDEAAAPNVEPLPGPAAAPRAAPDLTALRAIAANLREAERILVQARGV